MLLLFAILIVYFFAEINIDTNRFHLGKGTFTFDISYSTKTEN